jgi:hypothetical protein
MQRDISDPKNQPLPPVRGPYVPEMMRSRDRFLSYFISYMVSQKLRSLIRDLIPELILSQKHPIHKGPIGNGSGIMSFYSTVNKLERKDEHSAFIEICC